MFRQRTRLISAMVRPLIWLFVIGAGFGAVMGAQRDSRLPAVPRARRAGHDDTVRRHAGGADHGVRQGIRA